MTVLAHTILHEQTEMGLNMFLGTIQTYDVSKKAIYQKF